MDNIVWFQCEKVLSIRKRSLLNGVFDSLYILVYGSSRLGVEKRKSFIRSYDLVCKNTYGYVAQLRCLFDNVQYSLMHNIRRYAGVYTFGHVFPLSLNVWLHNNSTIYQFFSK